MNHELKRILLVEDDPDIQIVGQLALEAVGGFDVQVCSSGTEALLRAPSCEPELILLDVMMPGLDGPATLVRLREHPHLRHIPVIFLTAKVMPEQLASLQSLGAAGVITKPFDPMSLAEQVHGIWRAVSR